MVLVRVRVRRMLVLVEAAALLDDELVIVEVLVVEVSEGVLLVLEVAAALAAEVETDVADVLVEVLLDVALEAVVVLLELVLEEDLLEEDTTAAADPG